MTIENVKYIDGILEGSLLKYDVDEPLIAGNQNIYWLRISLANIDEAQNSVWKFLLAQDNCYFEAEFKSAIHDLDKVEPTVIRLEKSGDVLVCQVPDGSGDEGNELYGGYRLYIAVRGTASFEGKEYAYCTKEMANPPMVYSSGSFKTVIDMKEETLLRAFMNKFTGGEPGQIIVKRSDSDYDIDWKNTLPNQAIFGGNGTFIESGYQVILTPAAKEVLFERGVIEITDPDAQLIKIIVDFNKPMDYTGLEFLTTNSGTYTFNGKSFTVNTGDKLTSSGYDWGLVKASAIGMENSGVEYSPLEAPNDNLINYTVNINGQDITINLLSLLKNKDLSILHQLSNYAGKIQEIVDTSDDIVHKWRKLGTCFFKVYGDNETSARITMPVGYDGNGFVENFVINGSDELVFQRWTSNTGKRFYRSSAEVYGKWPYWTQEFDYDQTLPIANGGTDATTAAGARTKLNVYSKEETTQAIGDAVESKADLNTTTMQEFHSALRTGTITIKQADDGCFLRMYNSDEHLVGNVWRGMGTDNNNFYITVYPKDATSTTDRYNYRFSPPPKGAGARTLMVYHTGNIIYKTALPTFNTDTHPEGTICLVKVSG